MRAAPLPTGPRSGEFCVCARDPTRPMLGVALLALVGMPRTGPGSQDQDEARIAGRTHFMPLMGVEVRHRPDAGSLGFATLLQLDLPVDYDQVRVLVDLVLLELLPGRQVERDRARCPFIGAQNLRLVRLKI